MENLVHKETDGHFPWDLVVLLSPGILIGLLSVVSIYTAQAESPGDTNLLPVALILGGVGVVLLFLARLPLYRQHHFLTFGPGQLSGTHRRLYFAAYFFIVPCIFLLLALLLF